jgi:hypothetical protein
MGSEVVVDFVARRAITPADLPPPASTVPMPAGTSPFRVKGAAYRGLLMYVENSFPGGLPGLLKSLATDDLREFLQQSFLAASWYDILPVVPMVKVLAERAGRRFFDWVQAGAERQAQREMNGPHRLLFTRSQPGDLVDRIGAIFRQYHDYSECRVERFRGNRARLMRSGVPEHLAPWTYPATVGYARALVPEFREREDRITMYAPVPGPKLHGLPTITVVIEYAW